MVVYPIVQTFFLFVSFVNICSLDYHFIGCVCVIFNKRIEIEVFRLTCCLVARGHAGYQVSTLKCVQSQAESISNKNLKCNFLEIRVRTRLAVDNVKP